MKRRFLTLGAVLMVSMPLPPLFGQSMLERSPNVHGVWSLEPGNAVFVLSHRFEVLSGGDELFSVPTFTLAAGLPFGLTLGTEFTTLSEVVPGRLTGNEAQFWLKQGFRRIGPIETAVLGGYNTAAGSADAAVNARYAGRRLSVFAEGRFFSDMFGSGDSGGGGAIGAAVRVAEHVAITGDVGRVLTTSGVPSAWSAAIAAEIPGSPHTLAVQVTNAGATTLQGASREKTAGSSSVRYGFTFTIPIGAARWGRLFRPLAVVEPTTAGAVVAGIRQFDFQPREITIERGGTIEWINLDSVAHTVTGADGSWDSGSMEEGARYVRSFAEPGRYPFYCAPHPDMRGVVVVR